MSAEGERGSAVVLVAIIAAASALALTVIGFGGGLVQRQRIVGAADAAALAAADAASGAVAGEPCALAQRVAAAAGGRLERCRLDGLVASVRVSGSALGTTLTASARAGPPPDAVPAAPPDPAHGPPSSP